MAKEEALTMDRMRQAAKPSQAEARGVADPAAPSVRSVEFAAAGMGGRSPGAPPPGPALAPPGVSGGRIAAGPGADPRRSAPAASDGS